MSMDPKRQTPLNPKQSNPNSEETRVQAERDFLLARQLGGDHTWVGVSSDELVRAAMTGLPPRPFKHPYDGHDLARCEETYRRAPDHLKPAMKPILDGFRLMVSEREQWPNPRTAEQCQQQLADAIRRAAEDPLTPTPNNPESKP